VTNRPDGAGSPCRCHRNTSAAGAPRIQGDEVDLDDPAVDVVIMLCLVPNRWPVIRWFRRCYNTYPAPVEAHTLTTCTDCGVYAVSQTYLKDYNRRRRQ
jgi:hypothetical protein